MRSITLLIEEGIGGASGLQQAPPAAGHG